MTHQPGFSQAGFAGKKKITRREKFLARIDLAARGLLFPTDSGVSSISTN